MTLELIVNEKTTISLEQYKVVSGWLLDKVQEDLERYLTLVNEAPESNNIEGIDPTLLLKLKEGNINDLNTDELNKLFDYNRQRELVKSTYNTKEGRELLIKLTISITDMKQLDSNQKKLVMDSNSWNNEFMDIKEVGKYVNYFRTRL